MQKLYYHEEINRWTVGPSPIPHGYIEGEDTAVIMLESARAQRIKQDQELVAKDIARERERSQHQSGCVGVSWDTTTQKWAASIYMKGKQHQLGKFESLKHAISARHEAERRKSRLAPPRKQPKDRQNPRKKRINTSTMLRDYKKTRKSYK